MARQQPKPQLPRSAVEHLDDALEALRWAYSKSVGPLEPYRDQITAIGKEIAGLEAQMIIAAKAAEASKKG
jgi:hypothetical protein